MAGHSKFNNIKYRKSAQDQKKAKIFTKLVQDIITATKTGGTDTNNNPRLKHALNVARSSNLPKDRINKALHQGQHSTDHRLENRYEGFVLGGIAIIVETYTNNKNRSIAEIKNTFAQYGGKIGATGSVSFMFHRTGKIEYFTNIASVNEIIESALECGAKDTESNDTYHTIYTDVETFSACLDYMYNKYGSPFNAKITWKAKKTIAIENEKKAIEFLKLLDLLEKNEDVQNISTNYIISTQIIKKICT